MPWPQESRSAERSSKNPAYVDAVAKKNVQLTLADIRQRSPILRALEAQHGVLFAGSMYDLESGKVDFF